MSNGVADSREDSNSRKPSDSSKKDIWEVIESISKVMLVSCGCVLNANTGLTWKIYVNKDYGTRFQYLLIYNLCPGKGTRSVHGRPGLKPLNPKTGTFRWSFRPIGQMG